MKILFKASVRNGDKGKRRKDNDMKKYDIYAAGSVKIGAASATCISDACRAVIGTLPMEAYFHLESKEYASIRYKDNYSICSDFVVMMA